MVEEASLGFRLRKIDETKNYLLYEIKHNSTSGKNKKTCEYLNYVEHLLILASTVTGCVLISAFASLVSVPAGIRSSAVGINICAIIAGIKKCDSVFKKKMKKHNKTVLLGKDKLNIIEGLISKYLIHSYISHDKFASVNILREYNEIKKEIKNPEIFVGYTIYK